MKANIKFINNNKEQLTKEIYTLINNMNELNRTLGGSETRKELGEKDFLTINDRLSSARGGWCGGAGRGKGVGPVMSFCYERADLMEWGWTGARYLEPEMHATFCQFSSETAHTACY